MSIDPIIILTADIVALAIVAFASFAVVLPWRDNGAQQCARRTRDRDLKETAPARRIALAPSATGPPRSLHVPDDHLQHVA